MFQLEDFRGICHDTERWCKIYRQTACGLKNDLRNLVNFHASNRKSGNLHFDRVFCPKHIYEDLDEKSTEQLCFMIL